MTSFLDSPYGGGDQTFLEKMVSDGWTEAQVYEMEARREAEIRGRMEDEMRKRFPFAATLRVSRQRSIY